MSEKLTDGIKGLLSFKVKPREDGYSNQFSRIIMLKLMLVAALFVGYNWYSDKIICIVPTEGAKKDPIIDKDFVSAACWINGLYVYKNIRYHKNELGYYGLPNDINLDGILPNNQLCRYDDGKGYPPPKGCEKMQKTFFLQYQYMTFFMTALALLYYAPHALFRLVNADMVSLKKTIKEDDADIIIKNYFDDKVNPKSKQALRVIGEIVVKLLYIAVGVIAFLLTNMVLNDQFSFYGSSWVNWSKLNNSLAYDYMGKRGFPKPGDYLLPSYGYCDVHEGAEDVKTVVTNKHRFLCEMSQHILYQYILIIIWFAMVFSILVSVIGCIVHILDHLWTVTYSAGSNPNRKLYQKLSLREAQYLELIQKKTIPLYGKVMDKLQEYRYGQSSENTNQPH